MKKIRINLTLSECTALNRIASKTQMDYWFSLSTDKEGYDCVYDLESRRYITLRYGVKLLKEGIDGFTADEMRQMGICPLEQQIFKNLCKKLELEV
jgi:hypothetical protein